MTGQLSELIAGKNRRTVAKVAIAHLRGNILKHTHTARDAASQIHGQKKNHRKGQHEQDNTHNCATMVESFRLFVGFIGTVDIHLRKFFERSGNYIVLFETVYCDALHHGFLIAGFHIRTDFLVYFKILIELFFELLELFLIGFGLLRIDFHLTVQSGFVFFNAFRDVVLMHHRIFQAFIEHCFIRYMRVLIRIKAHIGRILIHAMRRIGHNQPVFRNLRCLVVQGIQVVYPHTT